MSVEDIEAALDEPQRSIFHRTLVDMQEDIRASLGGMARRLFPLRAWLRTLPVFDDDTPHTWPEEIRF